MMQETKDTIYGADTSEKQVEKSENSTNNSDVEYEWGKHPNSQKAIKKHQFPKGMSGNIMGRKPNFTNLKNQLLSLAEDEITNYRDEVMGTNKELVLKRIWRDARDGDMKKIQLLAWLGCLD
tara:strand:- start:146 stop:511 length:366 start_codon:yes stop_codon:yes gene_type:complete